MAGLEDSRYLLMAPSLHARRCYVDDKVSRVAWLNRSNIIFAGSDKWSLDPRVDLVTKGQLEYSLRIQKVRVAKNNYAIGQLTQHFQDDEDHHDDDPIRSSWDSEWI